MITVDVGEKKNVFINHGMPRQNRMSKMLLPIKLQMAMLAIPLLTTMTLAMISGTLIPAAKIVIPATESGSPKV